MLPRFLLCALTRQRDSVFYSVYRIFDYYASGFAKKRGTTLSSAPGFRIVLISGISSVWKRLAARIAAIAAATVVTGCYETAVIVATAAEENEKQDNPDTAAIVAVATEEATVVTAATATIVVGSTTAATAE